MAPEEGVGEMASVFGAFARTRPSVLSHAVRDHECERLALHIKGRT